MVIIYYILFVIGLYLLVKSADLIVDSASSMAKKFGVSSLMIGLTVVAFGTSLPELTIGIFSSFKGASSIMLGNVIGANIANVLLILGVAAIISEIKLKTETIWKQIPFALLVSFILFLFAGGIFLESNRSIAMFEGIVFLVLLVYFLYSLNQFSRKERYKHKSILVDFGILTSFFKFATKSRSEFKDLKTDISKSDWKIYVKLIIGMIGIYLGGRFVVEGATFIAGQLGMSQFLISATIISIGTTLPEFIVCIVAALRSKIDLAVGNSIGSVIFNILGVVGTAAIIRPIVIPKFAIFDIGVMFFAVLFLFIFMFIGKTHGLSKKEGVIFVLLYLLYIAYLIIRG